MHKIGEEYWSDWVSDGTSTDANETRILYRVVEIVKVHKYGKWGELIDAEGLEPIKVERRVPEFIKYEMLEVTRCI